MKLSLDGLKGMMNVNALKSKWRSKTQIQKGLIVGAVLGAIMWLLSIDFAIGLAVAPVAVVAGIVMLPYVILMLVTVGFFAVAGGFLGYMGDRMGAKQGVFTGAVVLLLLVGVFLYAYKPALSPAQASAFQTQPFETLADAMGAAQPMVSPTGYNGQTYGYSAMNPCPSDCIYGCLPTGTCKSIPPGASVIQ